jgi:hypothetical protein
MSMEYGQQIYSNVWGPCQTETPGGQKYFMSFTDDTIRETWLYLLKTKSEVFTVYKRFEAWVRTRMLRPIKVLHTD